MAKITLGDSKAGVTLSDDLSGYVRDAVRRAGGVVAERLEKATDKVVVEARARWPVGRDRDRPHSRDLFETELRVGPDGTLRGRIANEADYAFYIRSTQVGGGGSKRSAFQELVRKPAEAEADQIVRDTGDDLARVLGGR